MRRAFLFLLTISFVTSYKILVYNSKFSHSCLNFFGNIADLLIEAGHDVTSLIPEMDPSWGDGTIKSKKIHVPQAEELKPLAEALNAEFDWFGYNELDPIEPFFYPNPHAERHAIQCRRTLEEPGLIERLKEEKFDVMIAENFDMCGVALSHLIQPKAFINGAASVPQAWMVEEFGIPKAWSYSPSTLISHLDVHSFYSRLKNLYAEVIAYRLFWTSRWTIEALFKEKYGPNYPSLTEISSHAAFTIVNSEPLIDFATPTLSRIVYVGGIGAKVPKKVDKKFDEILALRSKTILISFGSIVHSSELKEIEKNSIVETAASFPDVTFIWKYETPEDDFAKKATLKVPNLHLFKWIPQNDLLADPRLTAFITHGGGGSTQETARRGKPGLFVPVFGDQPRNAGMMERSGLGKVFHKSGFAHSEKLIEAVRGLLENQSYYENSRRIASMIAKKPVTAEEMLIKTVEFAAEFGPSPALRPQSYDMSWIAYHNLDVIAFLGSIGLLLALLLIFLGYRTVALIFRSISSIRNESYSPVKN